MPGRQEQPQIAVSNGYFDIEHDSIILPVLDLVLVLLNVTYSGRVSSNRVENREQKSQPRAPRGVVVKDYIDLVNKRVFKISFGICCVE